MHGYKALFLIFYFCIKESTWRDGCIHAVPQIDEVVYFYRQQLKGWPLRYRSAVLKPLFSKALNLRLRKEHFFNH